MKHLPKVYITYDDSLEVIVQKSLKALQREGMKKKNEQYYKEQASVMTGRVLHASSHQHAMMIIQYYVRLLYK